MKILLIEDNRETAEHVAYVLRGQGHEVEESWDGVDAGRKARSGDHAALIVDRMLPNMDGLSLVRELREEGLRTPVLFLTTMNGIDDRVNGLECGADDYLSKPFAASELLARLNAITRRTSFRDETALLKAGNLEMNLLRRTITNKGEPIELQMQEFQLLAYLMRNAGRIVTRAMLLENVWSMDFIPVTNVVETHMSRLRAKIGCRGGEIIRTVRGMGYILRDD